MQAFFLFFDHFYYFLSTLFSDLYFIYFGSFPSISTYILSITCFLSDRSSFYVFQIKIKKYYTDLFSFPRGFLCGNRRCISAWSFLSSRCSHLFWRQLGAQLPNGWGSPCRQCHIWRVEKIWCLLRTGHRLKGNLPYFRCRLWKWKYTGYSGSSYETSGSGNVLRRRHTSGKQSRTYQTDPRCR